MTPAVTIASLFKLKAIFFVWSRYVTLPQCLISRCSFTGCTGFPLTSSTKIYASFKLIRHNFRRFQWEGLSADQILRILWIYDGKGSFLIGVVLVAIRCTLINIKNVMQGCKLLGWTGYICAHELRSCYAIMISLRCKSGREWGFENVNSYNYKSFFSKKNFE